MEDSIGQIQFILKFKKSIEVKTKEGTDDSSVASKTDVTDNSGIINYGRVMRLPGYKD